jgi:hypothetical protein
MLLGGDETDTQHVRSLVSRTIDRIEVTKDGLRHLPTRTRSLWRAVGSACATSA